MPNRCLLGAAAFLLAALALGCFVEVSGSASGSSPSSNQLASRLEFEFASKAGDATATIQCSSGLTGTEGNRAACQGETSDGWTLEIAVLERGGEDFRWDVTESVPVR